MIEGVTIREHVVREDERGYLAEVLSWNFGDESLCHLYRCFVRDGVAKAFHVHVMAHDGGRGQTDRFTCVRGCVKVGMIDLRGGLEYPESSWTYLGIDGTPKTFNECWPDDAWAKRIGMSSTFMEKQVVVLDAARSKTLWIPPGVAHGIWSLSPGGAEIINAPTVPYHREAPDELRLPADLFHFKWEPESK